MFTGLIEHMGAVVSRRSLPGGERLEINPRGWIHRALRGESIAVNGCCLTVADDRAGEGGVLAFDVVPETLARTSLGRLREGAGVNLERSATPTTLMGGHLVQGHVDGVGRVERVIRDGEYRVRVGLDRDVLEYVTPKGSVTIEGVSLTVAGVGMNADGGGWFEVALIPTTLEKTTLGRLGEGDLVNLETDIIGRTVIHWLKNFGDSAT